MEMELSIVTKMAVTLMVTVFQTQSMMTLITMAYPIHKKVLVTLMEMEYLIDLIRTQITMGYLI